MFIWYRVFGIFLISSTVAFAMQPSKVKLGDKLQQTLQKIGDDQLIDVEVFLKDHVLQNDSLQNESFHVSHEKDQPTKYFHNGSRLTESEFFSQHETYTGTIKAQQIRKQESIKKKLNSLEKATGINSIKDIHSKIKLTKKDIKTLSKHPDIIEAIQLSEGTKNSRIYTFYEALDNHNIIDYGHTLGLSGFGIGVHMNEDSTCPDPQHYAINSAYYTRLNQGDPDVTIATHATSVAYAFQQTAPEAHLYCSGFLYPGPEDTRGISPNIYITNHSYTSDWITSYNFIDKQMDNFVYDYRVSPIVAAGNSGNYVGSPGKAYNALTVGAIDPNNNTMASFSAFRNPTNTHAEKPEVVAPGDELYDPGYYPESGELAGTSYSTPIVSGYAALMLDMYSFMKYSPALLKSAIMAGATINIEGDARLSDHDGVGAINLKTNIFNRHEYYQWDVANGQFFDSNEEYSTTVHLVEESRYRIVISWLVTGDGIENSLEPDMDLDLFIEYNGNVIQPSDSDTNSFEIIDFTAPETDYYTIKIKRVKNNEPTTRVVLGMTLVSVF